MAQNLALNHVDSSRFDSNVLRGLCESYGIAMIATRPLTKNLVFEIADAFVPKGHVLSQGQLKGRDLRVLLLGEGWELRSEGKKFSEALSLLVGADSIQWDLCIEHFPKRTNLFGLDFLLRYIPSYSSEDSLVGVDIAIEPASKNPDSIIENSGSTLFNRKHHASERVVLDVRDELERLEKEVEKREREAQIAMQWLSDEGGGQSRPHLESILRDTLSEVKRLRSEGLRRSREILWIQELVSVGRPNMDDFLMDAYELTQELRWGFSEETVPEDIAPLLVSTLHTLKGNAGMYGFAELSAMIHDIEDDAVGVSDSLQMRSVFGELDELLKAYASLAYRMFRVDSEWIVGERPAQVAEVRVPEDRLDSALQKLRGLCGNLPESLRAEGDRIHTELRKFKGFSAEEVRRRLDVLIKNVSVRLGKSVVFHFEGGGVYFSDARLRHLIAALGHIVRNAIDHGIELPQDRLAAQKSEDGTLRIVIREDSDQVTMIVSDDGSGIDLSSLVARSLESGSISKDEVDRMSEAEKYQLIFLPGVSTKKDLSLFSGRGVGMYSAKLLIREQGGKIKVSSTAGLGTEFVITMPGEW